MKAFQILLAGLLLALASFTIVQEAQTQNIEDMVESAELGAIADLPELAQPLVVQAQVIPEPPDDAPGWMHTLAYILTAVMTVISYFLKTAQEKAKEGLIKAESKVTEVTAVARAKLDQINELASKIASAPQDNLITAAEIKGIAESIKTLSKL